MLGRVKRLGRRAARKVVVKTRIGLLRLLRPVVLRVDAHLQWLFDRQQDDRTRLVHLEQQVCALQRQLAALQREGTTSRAA